MTRTKEMAAMMLTELPCGFGRIIPQADSDELAMSGERLMIRFPLRWQPGEPVETRVASKDIVTAGWAIGVRPI